MNSTQRYVLALSRILVAIIFLLNGLGIISQAVAARELAEHAPEVSLPRRNDPSRIPSLYPSMVTLNRVS